MFLNSAFAHEIAEPALTDTISKTSMSVVEVGGFLVLFFVIISIINSANPSEFFKGSMFVSIVVISLAVTFYLAGSTIYLNKNSYTGGPVHWHADFRIFNCGAEVFLKEPGGLSNRLGTPILHSHNDNRIHIEGVVAKKEDIALHKFFEAIGGELSFGDFVLPTNKGETWLVNGNTCSDGRPARLQVFVYKTEGKIIRQEKLNNYPEYVMSGQTQIPPGDCIIFEFSPDQKDKTDKICNFTKIAIDKGNYTYEK